MEALDAPSAVLLAGRPLALAQAIEGRAQMVGGLAVGEPRQGAPPGGGQVVDRLHRSALDRSPGEMEGELLGVLRRPRSVSSLEGRGDPPMEQPLPGQADLP